MNNIHTKMLKEDYIILERMISEYGEAEVINEMRLPKNIVSKVAGAGLFAGSLLGLHGGMDKLNNQPEEKPIEQVQKRNPYGMSDSEYSLFKDRVNAVTTEIQRIFDIHQININELGFDPEYLVLLCHQHNYDIPLIMAQLRQESQFGTTDRARRYNSLFSIGAWDNGQNKAKYNNQNEAIKHYIYIMLEDYLDGGNISVDELLTDGKFVNYLGKRYAKDKKYERRLRSIRNSLITNYPCLASNINPNTYTSDTDVFL